jgi:hypothetical protein
LQRQILAIFFLTGLLCLKLKAAMFSLIKKWWWFILIAAGLAAILFYAWEAQQKVDSIEKELNKNNNPPG